MSTDAPRATLARLALVPLIVGLTVTTSAAAAAAGPPSAGCPQAFALRSVDEFSGGFQAYLTSVDKNGDQRVCTLAIPDAVPFPPINFVDNVAAS